MFPIIGVVIGTVRLYSTACDLSLHIKCEMLAEAGTQRENSRWGSGQLSNSGDFAYAVSWILRREAASQEPALFPYRSVKRRRESSRAAQWHSSCLGFDLEWQNTEKPGSLCWYLLLQPRSKGVFTESNADLHLLGSNGVCVAGRNTGETRLVYTCWQLAMHAALPWLSAIEPQHLPIPLSKDAG